LIRVAKTSFSRVDRKLLSLAEPGKAKRMPKISKSSYSLSPGPSPVQLRYCAF
jgi:hypothetical protein